MSSLKDTALIVKDWWHYLKSKTALILTVAVLGAIAGFTYGYLKKPAYTATTSFVLENSEGGAGGLGQYMGLASMVGLDLGSGGGVFQGDNILELYKSRQMIQMALLTPLQADSSKLLIDRYFEFNKPLADLTFSAKPRDPQLNRLQDSVIREVVEKINKRYLKVTKPNQRLDVINVEVTAKDEVFAKEFNDQIVQHVNDFYVQTKTKKSANNVAILQDKTDSVRAVMNGDIFSAVTVADATPNLNLTRQVRRMAPVQKAQFSAEANKVVLAELLKNLELAKVSLAKETPLIQLIDQPLFPLAKEKIYLSAYAALAFFVSLLFMVVALLLRKTVLDKLR
jgi:uncharacterized protein involved in exopolysaccharide biosynthesis